MRRKIVDRAEVQVSRGSWGEPDLRNFLGLAQRKNRAEPGYPSFRRSVRYGVCVRTSPTSSVPKGRLPTCNWYHVDAFYVRHANAPDQVAWLPNGLLTRHFVDPAPLGTPSKTAEMFKQSMARKGYW